LELQALIEDAQGAEYLTNARQVWRLSHRSLPDCDGDGLQDIVAVLGGLVLDVDDDLIPDTCALGPQTWFVDASAAPLGTGEPHRPFRDIASGVAKARAGETVIVADGNYTGPGNRNLNFFGRDLSLRSANGPLGCVIDCENLGRALVATHNESLSSLVQGFTIRRGNTEAAQTQNYYNGGGIFVIDCALTVRDCRIENCYASRSGGGVYAGYGELILEHCVMVSNSADSGGGLQIERGSVLVSQTDFEFGRSHFGAGVALDLGSDDVLHAQFSACTLRGNVAVNEAGGVFVIAREQNPAQFESCLFIGNRAPRGSALLTEFGNLELRDCTIAQNTSNASSAAVVLVDYPYPPHYTPFNVLRNTIVWSNYPLGGTAIRVEHDGQLDIDFCAVEGGAAAIVHPVAWPPIVGANVFDVDPRFQNPNGPDGNPLTLVDNDLRLALDSPCIDAGDNAAISADWADLDGDGDRLEPTPFDLQRRRRRLDVPAVPDTGVGAPPLVDFGCYERSATQP
jgi:hypothetical protein